MKIYVEKYAKTLKIDNLKNFKKLATIIEDSGILDGRQPYTIAANTILLGVQLDDKYKNITIQDIKFASKKTVAAIRRAFKDLLPHVRGLLKDWPDQKAVDSLIERYQGQY